VEQAHDEHGGVAGESGDVGAEAEDVAASGVPAPVGRAGDATRSRSPRSHDGERHRGAHPDAPSGDRADDAMLVDSVRAGDDTAYSELWTRHEPAARRLATRIASPSDVDDLVSESFTRTLDAIRSGGGPGTAFRPYLLTTLRRVNIDVARRYTSRVVLTDDEAAVDSVSDSSAEDAAVEAEERDAVWAAWRSLPDESRSLLWELVVHEEKPHQLAPRLGTTPNGVASRSKRARERLRQVFLSELVANAGDPQCREVRRQLGGYVRDSLPAKARERVDEHLDRCARCRAAVLDVIDVDAAIRLRVAPVLLPGAFAAAGGAGASVGSAAAGALGTGPAGAAAWATAAGAAAPEPVLGVESFLDDIEGLGACAGATSGGSTVVGKVLSVPGRSAAAVVAAAAIIVAAVLFLVQSEPAGQVAADASTGRDSSSGMPGGSESGWPTTTEAAETGATSATTAPGPVIGVATAEVARLREPAGVPGGRPLRPGTTSSPGTSTAGSPSSTSSTSPAATTPPPPGDVGTVTRLLLEPGDQGTYLAHLEAPDGWLITSVLDRHGARATEHVSSPTRVLDDRLRAGQLVIEVTRTRTGLTGELRASFEDQSGELLAGSGSYPLL
jgi:RNA polymerase sigma factor (sigma-70 family)